MKLTKEEKLKQHKRKYPLICPVCKTVARAEFRGELCGVCKESKFEERN